MSPEATGKAKNASRQRTKRTTKTVQIIGAEFSRPGTSRCEQKTKAGDGAGLFVRGGARAPRRARAPASEREDWAAPPGSPRLSAASGRWQAPASARSPE